jgi:hypothetical protein
MAEELLRFTSVSRPDKDGWSRVLLPDNPWWAIAVRVTEVDGVPQLTSLRIEPANVDRAVAVISHERLRRLPLGVLATAAAGFKDGDVEQLGAAFEAQHLEWPQGRRRPDSHYRDVAEVYLAALKKRQPPVKAVQDRWLVGRAMASRYVARARELGYLGAAPTRPGVAGVQNVKTEKKTPARKSASKKGR